MNRVALSIVGGLMGFGSGLLFLQPVKAFFGATTVTWNASNCPTGVFNITSFAKGDDGTVVDSVTTNNVSLPKPTFTQQFSKLTARSWQVAAITTGGGKTFRSTTQAVQGLGINEGERFGRARPATSPSLGLARSRNTPAPPPPREEPRSTAPEGPAALQPMLTTNLPSPGRAISRLLAEAQPWRLFIAEDLDGDGIADFITIETEAGVRFEIRFGPAGLR